MPKVTAITWALGAMLACSAGFHPSGRGGPPADDTSWAPPGDSGAAPETLPSAPEDTGLLWEMCEVTLDCDEPIVDDPKVACTLTVADASGSAWYSGPAGVEVRGRSSQGFDKKQYGVELWDLEGEQVEVDLLGMGAEADWVLNGAWIDRALLRNKLGFDLFQSFGGPERYAPESAYCTLTLNGEWHGIYFLSERIEREDCRVDIEASDVGESFVVKVDDGGGLVEHTTGHGYWKLVYPHPERSSEEAQAAVTAWLEAWMTALSAGDAAVEDMVDLDSAADFVILQEFMKNNDAYYLSVHAWKDVGGQLRFAPWDLDLTLGQPTYNDNVPPEGWIAYRPVLVSGFMALPGFPERLADRWAELREGPLAEEAVLDQVAAYRAIMGETVYENFETWPFEDVEFGGYLPDVADFDEEYENIRAWIPQRLAWMDDNIDEY